MALVLADRVRETTTTTGTGTISLGGPVSGFQGFSTAIGNANTTYYTIADAATGAWEVGLGTYTSSGSTLARTTILSSSNAGAAVNFAAGTKDVFVTQPAERALYLNGAGTGVDAGAAAFTLNGVPYANSTSTLTTGSALTFDGTNLTNTSSSVGTPEVAILNSATSAGANARLRIKAGGSGATTYGDAFVQFTDNLNWNWSIGAGSSTSNALVFTSYFGLNLNEQARLTSSGLEIKQSQLIGYSSYAGIGTNGLAVAGNVGVGTASPAVKLHVLGSSGSGAVQIGSSAGANQYQYITFGGSIGGTDFGWQVGRSSNTAGLGGDGAFYFYDIKANATRMSIDAAGNLGLGVTPSNFAVVKAFQAEYATLAGNSSVNLATNAYYNSGWKYTAAASALLYTADSGSHKWYVSTSAQVINTDPAFSQAMTLDASGNLMVGFTSSSAIANKNIDVNGTGDAAFVVRVGGTTTSYLYSTAGQTILGTVGALPITFNPNNTERARISSDGTFRVKGAGTAGSTDAFQVAGTAIADSMVLNSSGNLGVGTASPAAKLHIAVASAAVDGTKGVKITNPAGTIAVFECGSVGDSFIGTTSGSDFNIRVNNAVVATFLNGGNVGIGNTSPSSYNAAADNLVIGSSGSNGMTIVSGTTSAGYIMFADGTVGQQAYEGQITYDHASNFMAFNTSATERARITSAGNVVIGSTDADPLSLARERNLAIVTTGTNSALTIVGGGAARIDFGVGATRTAGVYSDATNFTEIFTTTALPLVFSTNNTQRARISSDGTFRVKGAGTAGSTDAFQVAGTAPADAARIDSSGNLLVGAATAISSGSSIVNLGTARQVLTIKGDSEGSYTQGIWSATTIGDNLFAYFGTETSLSVRGSISYNRAGGVVLYNTTSDYRAKDIIGPVQNPGATIDALKVYEGQMKGATQSRPMLIAHEAQAFTPYAVTGEKDALNEDGTPKYQQMDVSSLVPLLLAELQALRARVAALEAA